MVKNVTPTETSKRSNTDWDAMETPWRAGIHSVSKLSKDFGVSRAAIVKYWDRRNVTRDLTARIQAEAATLVARAEVTRDRLQRDVAGESLVTDKETVFTNAAAQAAVILAERQDVRRFRLLTNNLLDELEAQTLDRDLYAKLAELMEKPDDKGMDKLNDLYRKVITTSSRVDSTKKLSDTLKTLIGLERQVLNIADAPQDDPNSELTEAVTDGMDKLREAFDKRLGK